MSNLMGRLGAVPTAYIIKTEEIKGERVDSVTCPYCGAEHQHHARGIVSAICMHGEYNVTAAGMRRY